MADDYPADLPPEIHAFEYRDGGPLAPVHGIGTSLLIAPFLAVRDTMFSARVGMVVVFALFGAALLSLLRAVGGRRSPFPIAVWAAVMVTLPVLVFSFEVYPDMPGALLVTLALRALVAERFRPLEALAVGLCAGFLPFLHVRFGMIAVPLVVAAAVRLGRDPAALAPLVVPFAALLGILALAFWHMYGSPLPDAQYDVEPFRTDNRFALLKAYRFGLGSVLGWTTGLIPFAPLFWFGVVGVTAYRVKPVLLAAGVGIVGLYLVVVGGHGPVVNAFPGRTMIVFLPLLALGILGAVRVSPVLAAAALVAAVVSAGVAYQGVRNLILVYDVAEVRLPLARRLEPAFPWFSVPAGGTELRYDTVAEGVGEMLRTPPVGIRGGMYDLDVRLSTDSPDAVVEVDVVRAFDQMPYASWTLRGPDVRPSMLRFSVPDIQQIQFVVTASGAPVRLDGAYVQAGGRGPLPIGTANRDLPLTAVWAGMTVITAALIWGRRRADTPPAQ